MFSRCCACLARLGQNEVLEPFPVGRRLAFDPQHGRLWVLCARCRNWNLAPIEERWEAIGESERLFESAAIGASTENISLGRLREGTELVRIGRTDRRELAAWRYANRIVRRWRRSQAMGYAAVAGAVAIGAVTGVGTAAAILGTALGWAGLVKIRDYRPALQTRAGHMIRFGAGSKALLQPASNDRGWVVVVPRSRSPVTLEGDETLSVLRRLLPRANFMAGRPEDVDAAAWELQRLGSAESLIRVTAAQLRHDWNMDPNHNPFSIGHWGRARPHRVAAGMPFIRLAVEMAANEEVERRALEGEVGLLEQEWREAEELAAIADRLLIPESVSRWIARHKETSGLRSSGGAAEVESEDLNRERAF